MNIRITIKTKDGTCYVYDNISEAIKKARIDAGLSQEMVAQQLGIKTQNWQKYEYGERTPKNDVLEKIALILNIDVEVLTSFKAMNEKLNEFLKLKK